MQVSAGAGAGDKLDLRAGDDVRIYVDGATAHKLSANFANNGDISFYEDTGTTAKLFWDASAESLGIGTSAPGSLLELEATGSTVFDGTATDGQAADGTTLAIQNLSDTDNTFSQILFRNRNTSKAVSRIVSLTDSTGTEMAFVVENNGSPAEVLRLEKTGNLLVGTTSTTDSAKFSVLSSGTAASFRTTPTTTTSLITFRNGNGLVGSISTNGSATSYNTSSDQRLKDNIVDAPSASDDIDAIQVRSFDWKADESHQKYGMVAQELQSVAPEAVTGDADSDDMMGVDYSKLVPMMMKEIQSLRARVAQLEGEN
jgi:hypothetical protein